jgi:plasmid stabilization system protein ParE
MKADPTKAYNQDDAMGIIRSNALRLKVAASSRSYSRYLLFYTWHGDTIEILRIKHGMMDLPRLFGGKPPAE